MIAATSTEASQKERILLFARDKFLRDGFAKVSVDELASEMSISKKTFYKSFGSKDELLAQIVESIISEIAFGFQAILSGDESFVKKLDNVMLFVGRQIGKVVRPFMFDLQRHEPRLWQRVLDFRRSTMMANMQGLFQEGIRGGFLRKDINMRVLILSFVATVETIMVPSVLANESFSGDEAMRSVLRIFFHGILTEDASRQLYSIQQNPSLSMS